MNIKIALGLLLFNEEKMLNNLLPCHLTAFDGSVAVDTGSTDDTLGILRRCGIATSQQKWVDFSTGRNQVLELAAAKGYTHCLMLDADESMLKSDILKLKSLDLDLPLAFPRYEFIDDYEHINPIFYPDYHFRLIPLNAGYRYVGRIHEYLKHNNIDGPADCYKIPFIHVYHYGKLKSPAEIMLKYENADLTDKGLPRVSSTTKIPPVNFNHGHKIRFLAPRPI